MDELFVLFVFCRQLLSKKNVHHEEAFLLWCRFRRLELIEVVWALESRLIVTLCNGRENRLIDNAKALTYDVQTSVWTL